MNKHEQTQTHAGTYSKQEYTKMYLTICSMQCTLWVMRRVKSKQRWNSLLIHEICDTWSSHDTNAGRHWKCRIQDTTIFYFPNIQWNPIVTDAALSHLITHHFIFPHYYYHLYAFHRQRFMTTINRITSETMSLGLQRLPHIFGTFFKVVGSLMQFSMELSRIVKNYIKKNYWGTTCKISEKLNNQPPRIVALSANWKFHTTTIIRLSFQNLKGSIFLRIHDFRISRSLDVTQMNTVWGIWNCSVYDNLNIEAGWCENWQKRTFIYTRGVAVRLGCFVLVAIQEKRELFDDSYGAVIVCKGIPGSSYCFSCGRERTNI